MDNSFSVKPSGLLRRVLLVTFLCSCALLFTALLFYFINPVSFRKFIFQPAREIMFFQTELELIPNWNKIEKVIISSGKKVIIPPVDKSELKIIADLRVPKEQGQAPAMLLLHGSSPWGRRSGLISLLAFRLQQAGWIVLAPDARGFGETGDPQEIANPEVWNVKNDVRRCLDYLLSHPRTDSNRVYVFGHSMGAGHALEGALDDFRARALVLVGTPRFVGGVKVTLWKRVRFSAERGLSHPVSQEVIRARILKLDISLYAKGQLKKKGHKPILLVDGGNEGDKNLNFLAKVAAEVSPPLVYWTLDDAGHYCGVYNFFGSDSIYYRPDLFNPFIKMLTDYFHKIEAEYHKS